MVSRLHVASTGLGCSRRTRATSPPPERIAGGAAGSPSTFARPRCKGVAMTSGESIPPGSVSGGFGSSNILPGSSVIIAPRSVRKTAPGPGLADELVDDHEENEDVLDSDGLDSADDMDVIEERAEEPECALSR